MNNYDDEENEISTDYENRCGNCHYYMQENEKYCKYCGTARGEGKFKPYKNVILCVYGPPVKLKYECMECHSKWITTGLGGNRVSYCPQCKSQNIDILKKKVL